MQLSFITDKQGLENETLFTQGRHLTKALSVVSQTKIMFPETSEFSNLTTVRKKET